MAVYVFDVNYTLKSGTEERDWVAKIAAFTKEEAIDTVAKRVGAAKIARINSIGIECQINEISDQFRKKIGVPVEVVKEVKPEKVETVWRCPYTEKEFKSGPALKAHFTRMGMKPQEINENEKSEFEFSEE